MVTFYKKNVILDEIKVQSRSSDADEFLLERDWLCLLKVKYLLCTEKEKLKFIFSCDQKGQRENCKTRRSFQSDASIKIIKYCLQLKVDTKNRMKS
jgi:hypothetical protein